MSIKANFMDEHLSAYSNNSKNFYLWGIFLMIAGLIAVTATTFTTLVTVMVLGFLILFSGCVVFLDTFTFWYGKDHGFVMHLLIAILYLAAGVLLISNPVAGSISLTFALGLIYTILGIARIFFSTAAKLPHWGWNCANGVVTLLIGLLILMSWPASSLFIIGLFVGIDLFFCGLAYMMVGKSLAVQKRR